MTSLFHFKPSLTNNDNNKLDICINALGMYQKLVFVVFFFAWMSVGFAQVPNNGSTWGTLAMVQKEKVFDEAMGFEVDKITVGVVPKMMAGQTIEIKGYIIPLEGKIKQSHFMLSAFPFNMCFFCGKAGPETAMQVFMKDDKKVAFTEDKINLKGTLRINENDISGLLYTLENATKL